MGLSPPPPQSPSPSSLTPLEFEQCAKRGGGDAYIHVKELQIKCEKHVPTNSSPGGDEVSLLARFSLAGEVDSRNPECVLQTLNQAGASGLGGFNQRLVGLHPQKAVPLLLLNAVSSDRRAAIAAGPLPGQDNKVFIDFVDLEVLRLTGWIYMENNAKCKQCCTVWTGHG